MSTIGGFTTVHGDTTIKFEPTELHHDPRRGMSFRKRAFGPLNSAGLLQLLQQVQALGGTGRMVFDHGDPVYEYELPGIPSDLAGFLPEKFFDTWELVANESTDSIFENYNAMAALESDGAQGYNDSVVLSRADRNSSTIAAAVTSCNVNEDSTLLGGPFVTPTCNTAAELFRMIRKGQNQYEKPQRVLSHVSCCSPTSYYNTARANNMRIYTPSQLLSEVGGGWTNNLPNRMYSEIAAIPVESAPSPSTAYYTWGWLKKITRTSMQTNSILEVSTEYICGLWSNLLYAAAV